MSFQVIKRSLRLLCPRCGDSSIFEEKGLLYLSCPACHLPLRSREPDTWFFMYMSTAGITGIFLWFFFFIFPRDWFAARLISAGLSLWAFVGSLKWRKSIAIGLDYLQNPEDLS